MRMTLGVVHCTVVTTCPKGKLKNWFSLHSDYVPEIQIQGLQCTMLLKGNKERSITTFSQVPSFENY